MIGLWRCSYCLMSSQADGDEIASITSLKKTNRSSPDTQSQATNQEIEDSSSHLSAMNDNLLVISQVILPPESLATDVTGVWPLVCVSALVYQQIVGLAEVSATVLAYEFFFHSEIIFFNLASKSKYKFRVKYCQFSGLTSKITS